MDVPYDEEGGSAVTGEDRSILYRAFHTALLGRAEQDSGGVDGGGQDSGDHGLHPAIKTEVEETVMDCVNIHDDLMNDSAEVGHVKSEEILDDTVCDTDVKNESEETCHDDSLVTNLNSVMEENYDVFKSELEKCDYQATKKINLTTERQTVDEDAGYQCTQCDFQATQQADLKIHIQAVHEGIKYQCTQCDYQATKQSHLKIHIQAVHEGIKYQCPQCDYQATAKGYLKIHIQAVHEGIKYPCTQCDYQATTKRNLKTHMQAVHEGNKY